MDLAELNTQAACDKGAEIELLHPTSKVPLGQFIHIVGRDSTIMREHTAEVANAARQRAFEANKRGEEIAPNRFEQDEADGVALLVKCTQGWHCKAGPFLEYKGELPFSPENARKLYTECVWIRAQVDKGILDLRNFIKS